MKQYCEHVEKWFFTLAMILIVTSCGVSRSINDVPELTAYNASIPERNSSSDSSYVAGKNFLTKNKHGLWELYVEGDPLERGLLTGSLTQELMEKQERIFFSKVKELVPSKSRQKFLRKFLAWYNRKMYQHIPEEYKAEIFGLAKYASSTYNYIAPPYLRLLYLHSAHDIGHALQDLALVGCSSFAVWGDRSNDGKLLIGRNLDFYAGDAFAEEKMVAFVAPSTGYNFMSVTWGGMMGVVSGMNDQGLTVTINAGKSKIPLVAKTPISLVTREILQYASTIDEAIKIAKKREVFVSEAIFIGSAKDKKAAVIEVSPNNFGVYEVENQSKLLCTNHFQSDAFRNDRRNLKQIEESHSQYRFDRMEELLAENDVIGPTEAVKILRNREGLKNKKIGFGNEKALNQLLAHHGIVFQPEDLKVWVSTNPYQLGEFVAYDLDEVFSNRSETPSLVTLSIPSELISEDPFTKTEAFKNYEAYRILERTIEAALEADTELNSSELSKVTTLNPDYWKAHYLVGRYYYKQEQYKKASEAFQKANSKEITTVPDAERVVKYLKKSNRKAKQ